MSCFICGFQSQSLETKIYYGKQHYDFICNDCYFECDGEFCDICDQLMDDNNISKEEAEKECFKIRDCFEYCTSCNSFIGYDDERNDVFVCIKCNERLCENCINYVNNNYYCKEDIGE